MGITQQCRLALNGRKPMSEYIAVIEVGHSILDDDVPETALTSDPFEKESEARAVAKKFQTFAGVSQRVKELEDGDD